MITSSGFITIKRGFFLQNDYQERSRKKKKYKNYIESARAILTALIISFCKTKREESLSITFFFFIRTTLRHYAVRRVLQYNVYWHRDKEV